MNAENKAKVDLILAKYAHMNEDELVKTIGHYEAEIIRAQRKIDEMRVAFVMRVDPALVEALLS